MAVADDDCDQPITYRDAGVDIDAGNALVKAIKPAVRQTSRPGADSDLGGFGGLFDLQRAGFKDPVLVACNDGVGTKLKIAIESGLHDTIGIDLVAMCVNDLIVQGAEPLFFLDYLATAKLDVATATSVISGIARGCKMSGCALIGGETAEMPGMYHGSDYDLAGFAVGAVERGDVLPKSTVTDGDCIIGLAASGVHSNGYSLVRRLVESANLDYGNPAPWQPDRSLANALLEPTRIYVAPVLKALRSSSGTSIKALSHITGGGLTENLPRVLPAGCEAVIDLSAIAPPAVFSWIAKEGRLDEAEMLRTFNCGIGMAVITEANAKDEVMQAFREAGENARQIGTITTLGQPTDAAGVSYTGRLEFA